MPTRLNGLSGNIVPFIGKITYSIEIGMRSERYDIAVNFDEDKKITSIDLPAMELEVPELAHIGKIVKEIEDWHKDWHRSPWNQ